MYIMNTFIICNVKKSIQLLYSDSIYIKLCHLVWELALYIHIYIYIYASSGKTTWIGKGPVYFLICIRANSERSCFYIILYYIILYYKAMRVTRAKVSVRYS